LHPANTLLDNAAPHDLTFTYMAITHRDTRSWQWVKLPTRLAELWMAMHHGFAESSATNGALASQGRRVYSQSTLASL